MSVTFKLPKLNVDRAIVLNTPAAADATLVGGDLKVKDEAGDVALQFRFVKDGISYTKTAYAAGTASVKTVTVPTPANNALYSIQISLPNRQDFFLGGKESNALVTTRTYTVSTDNSGTATELKDAFVAAINADEYAGVTAASTGAATFTITLDDVNSGDSVISVPAGFAAVTVGTPYVAPSGTYDEVVANGGTGALTNGEYSKWVIVFDKKISHNAVSGLKVFKEMKVVVYAEENAGTFGAFETALDDILDVNLNIDDTSAATVATTTQSAIEAYLGL